MNAYFYCIFTVSFARRATFSQLLVLQEMTHIFISNMYLLEQRNGFFFSISSLKGRSKNFFLVSVSSANLGRSTRREWLNYSPKASWKHHHEKVRDCETKPEDARACVDALSKKKKKRTDMCDTVSLL